MILIFLFQQSIVIPCTENGSIPQSMTLISWCDIITLTKLFTRSTPTVCVDISWPRNHGFGIYFNRFTGATWCTCFSEFWWIAIFPQSLSNFAHIYPGTKSHLHFKRDRWRQCKYRPIFCICLGKVIAHGRRRDRCYIFSLCKNSKLSTMLWVSGIHGPQSSWVPWYWECLPWFTFLIHPNYQYASPGCTWLITDEYLLSLNAYLTQDTLILESFIIDWHLAQPRIKTGPVWFHSP